jgi:hypothetical protein
VLGHRKVNKSRESMFYSSGFSIELWFLAAMRRKRLLDQSPIALSTVMRVIGAYLPNKAKTALEYINDPDDVDCWLDLVLKTDCILLVENIDGQNQRVAIDVSANFDKAQSKFNEINQSSFFSARRELKIERHWIVIVNPEDLPIDDDLADVFYEVVDLEKKCVMIDFRKPKEVNWW